METGSLAFVAVVGVVALQALSLLSVKREAASMRALFDVLPLRVADGPDLGEDRPPSENLSVGLFDQVACLQLSLTDTNEGLQRELVQRLNMQLATPAERGVHFGAATVVADELSARLERRASIAAATPVYLGLMGTFLGVILGVSELSSGDQFSEQSIQRFLSGILVAMTSSLAGVLMMVLANSRVLPAARAIRDRRRHGFLEAFSRILDSVVPRESDAESATSHSIGELGSALDRFAESIEPQRRLVETLQTLDLPRIVQSNVGLLRLGEGLAKQVEAFSQGLGTVNELVQTTGEVVTRAQTLLERFEGFEDALRVVAAKVGQDHSITDSSVEWIQAQLDSFRQRKDVVEQYVNEQDFMVKQIALQHREQVEKLAAQAAQTVVDIGGQIAAELRKTAEPAKVAALVDHVAMIPILVDQQTKVVEALIEHRKSGESTTRTLAAALDRLDSTLIRAAEGGPFRRSMRRLVRRLRGEG